MATTAVIPTSSSDIRRQIGIARARLERALSATETALPPVSTNVNGEDISDDYDELSHFHETLVKPFSRLQALHQGWLEMMAAYPEEKEVYLDFVERKGDYTTLMERTVQVLEELDSRMAQLRSLADSLHVEITTSPSPDSAETLRHHGDLSDKSVFMTTPKRNLRDAVAMSNGSIVPSNSVNFGPPPGLPMPMNLPAASQFPGQPGIPAPSVVSAVSPVIWPAAASAPAVASVPGILDAALLTRLDVPVFSGSLIDFPEFWNRFTALVDSKATIDQGSKFSLLKSCLKGSALDCIAGIPVTSDNYALAVSLLQSTYNDPTTTRHLLLSKLLNLPSCDERTLSQRFAQMNALVRQYICVAQGSTELTLTTALINKLPRKIRSKVIDKTPTNTNLKPTELMEILGEIVRKEFMLDSMTSQRDKESHHQDVYFNAATSKRKKKDRRKDGENRVCQLCGQKHAVHQCVTHPTPFLRVQAVRQMKLCFNCLQSDHACAHCPSNRSCRTCGKRHHSALCTKIPESGFGSTNGQNRYSPAMNGQNRFSPAAAESRSVHSTPHVGQPKTAISAPRRQVNSTHFVDVVSESPQTPTLPQETEVIMAATDVSTIFESPPAPTVTVSTSVALMCLPVTLVNPDHPEQKIRTTAFFDSGSTRTYISRDIARDLELKSLSDDSVVINVFGKTKTTMDSQLHNVSLMLSDSTPYQMEVRSLPALAHEVPCAVVDHDNSEVVDLMETVRLVHTTPGILIGSDHFWNLIIWENFYTKPMRDGLRMLNTRLGVIAAGPTLTMDSVYFAGSEMPSNPLSKDNLDVMVERFWQLETAGTTDTDTSTKDDDAKCLEHFQSHIRFEESESRYYVKWPFRTSTEDLPTNFKLAYSRLWNTWKQLIKNQENMEKYAAILEDQMSKDIIEVIPFGQSEQGKVHFLAHHAVVTEHKTTTKIRMVFDASAREKGKLSLNDSLYRGPVLLPDVCGILLRCRFAPILLSSDIEKAFLMVGLEEEDRDFTRFLWLKDPKLPPYEENLVVMRFRRVPFGVISSPFMLAGTIHHHLSNDDSDISRKLLKNLYVDNAFIEATTVEEALSIYAQSKDLFKKGGMNLREWVSNNAGLNKEFASREGVAVSTNAKLLGIPWNAAEDTLRIALQKPNGQMKWTKRTVLKFIAKTFDPLGLLTPVLLPYKLFLQSLWKSAQPWDDLLSDVQQLEWTELLDTNDVKDSFVQLKRHIPLDGNDNKLSLHVFSDASDLGYAACAYLRIESTSSVGVHLLMAKSRLPPAKKEFTIPRLELMGITMASSLVKYLLKELDLSISSVWMWTDSRVALSWCISEKHLPIFIMNRVNKVKENAPTAKIRHVRSEDNPADVASRGCDLETLSNDDLWWNGPSFLRQPEEEWPVLQDASEEPCQVDFRPPTDATFAALEPEEIRPSLIEIERFNNWDKLLNTVVFVLLFLKIHLGQCFDRFALGVRDDRRRALWYLFRMAQQAYPPSDHIIRQLNLRKSVEGLWIMYSRARPNSTLVYLPQESRIAELYVLHVHRVLLHSGYSCVLNQLRRSVWIPKGRAFVKRMIRKECFKCRRQNAQPFALPPFPVLPNSRTERPPYPFYHTGVDYLGPFNTLDGRKAHICLFTCMATRLIHVEVAEDLSAHTFVNILRRFIAGQGCPRTLISDNALHFTTTASAYVAVLLKEDTSFPEFGALCKHHRIEFKFIPAFAPWAGGFYERMVGIFKKALGHAIGRMASSVDDLRTFATEAAGVVNCRPLTYVTNDHSAPFVTAIRPIDFARPSVNISAPILDMDDDTEWRPRQTTQTELIDFWSASTACLDRFWKRWSIEYLQGLQERYQKNHVQGHRLTRRSPAVGEVVLIHQELVSRGHWKLGRIIELLGDAIRSARVRLAGGREITRPISLLYPLEISSASSSEMEDQPPELVKEKNRNEEDDHPKNIHPMVTRTKKSKMLLFAITLFCLVLPSAANEVLCPKELTDKNVLFAESCKESSIAVISYSFSGNKRLCWESINCTVGHVHFTPPALRKANVGLCGARCFCPATSSCVFYDGPRRQESTFRNIPDRLSTYQPPQVCSFVASPHCSSSPRMTTVPVITLFDNTSIIVETLSIQQPQFDSADPPICINTSGEEITYTKEMTVAGTTGFCANFKCTNTLTSSVFCMVRTPTAIFKSGNFSIPVASWGHELRRYFSFPEGINTTESPSIIILCSKGGVQLYHTDDNFIEACIGSTCIHHPHYEDGDMLLFPTQLVLTEYVISVRAWTSGQLNFVGKQECPGHPICETISCLFCKEHIWNYQCWNAKDAVLVIATWTTGAVLYFILSPMWLLIRLLWFLLKPLFWICRRCRIRNHAIPTVPVYRPRRHFRSLMLAMLLLPMPVLGCSETTSVIADSRNCIVSDSTETCTVDTAITLTVQPLAQEVCLVLRDNNDRPFAFMKIHVTSVRNQCNKRSLFHTRDHGFFTESSHRCYKSGSCQAERCETTKIHDRLREFTNEANDAPGYTFCTGSCSCATCNGCFLCSPSCLFYRYYSRPTSTTVYTVFDCPTWTTSVTGTATLELEGESSSAPAVTDF